MEPTAGVIAAAVTPRAGSGVVDLGAAFELLDFLAKGGVSGTALFTSTGEYACFPLAERARVTCLSVKRSRVPVWVGVGSASLEDSVRLGREARDSGAFGLILPRPLLFQGNGDHLREFYLQFAGQLNGAQDVLLDDAPPELVRELTDSGSFLGSADAVLPAACAIPEIASRPDCALLDEFRAWEVRFPHPVAVKVATGLRGIKTGPLSFPMPPDKQQLLEEFQDWFRAWLPDARKQVSRV